LDLLEKGLSAFQVINQIKKTEKYLEYRQVLVIDSKGQTALHSGENSLGIWSDAKGLNVLSAGNLLANSEVPQANCQNI